MVLPLEYKQAIRILFHNILLDIDAIKLHNDIQGTESLQAYHTDVTGQESFIESEESLIPYSLH